MNRTHISVILSTYNNPSALEKSLWGYRDQTDPNFELLIADDGSGPATRQVIEQAQQHVPARITHVWHEDLGFRKSAILNRAITMAAGDYLIFTDGDCIPREDFVASHREHSRQDYFIAGGSHIDIPQELHQTLTADDVSGGRVFDATWLARQGMNVRRCRWRLTRHRSLATLLDYLTPRPGVFLGCNGSAWKKDILAVNGFDPTSSYGSDDKELGARLSNNGIRSRRLKHTLICVHLWHEKNYPADQIRRNKEKLQRIKLQRITWIANGIDSSKAA